MPSVTARERVPIYSRMSVTRNCPSCHRPMARMQRSGPKGTPAGQGPAIAYPCQCWLTPAVAQRIAAQIAADNERRSNV